MTAEGLTIFGLPKAFRGQFANIQRNAIRSWARLEPKPEILLFGTDEGTREMAAEIGARHLPELTSNTYGTPLVDGLFAKAQEEASNALLCYVNSDIILTSDFRSAVSDVSQQLNGSHFVAVGRKTSLPITELIEFDTDWEDRLQAHASAEGHYVTYDSDYFVFRRPEWRTFPPFAIGRCYWSSWLVYDARRRGVPVIDMTDRILAVEPRHDYSHAISTGGHARLSGPEFEANRKLFKGCHYYTTVNATAQLRGGRLESPPGRNRILNLSVRSEYWIYFLLKGRWYPYSMPLIWLARQAATGMRTASRLPAAIRRRRAPHVA